MSEEKITLELLERRSPHPAKATSPPSDCHCERGRSNLGPLSTRPIGIASSRGALLAMTPRQPGRSARDGLGVAEKAAVWGAAWAVPQTFVRQGQGNVALTGAYGGLGQGPVHDVTLRVA